MKNKFLIILFFSSFILTFSQKNKPTVIKEERAYFMRPKLEKEVIDSTKTYSQVEQQPEFPGGISAFRKKFANAFNNSIMDGDSGRIKCHIQFVINLSGKIIDVKASGNNLRFNQETVRVIKSITTLCTLAKINNQSVRYLYTLPVVMLF